MLKIKKSSQQGFSLIECMIALVILSITMLGVIQLFGISIRQSSFARYNTLAVVVAQDKLERLQTEYNYERESGTPAASLTDGPHGPETVTLQAPAGSGTGDREFLVSWEVDVSGTGLAKTITASVAPVVVNEFETKTLTMTAVFAQ